MRKGEDLDWCGVDTQCEPSTRWNGAMCPYHRYRQCLDGGLRPDWVCKPGNRRYARRPQTHSPENSD